ncbi:MAG: NADH-quinone oxidoreductase subunit NuoH [Zetaproteobacteria bacterium CG12_big_fil_rev_8_21_14_0_65_55_1124]|nr:MAG: NADH-quinone oxidoreductase subunit H [Zetaproteobacteria bacterium CG1_02_55_237]PIS19283.1 MAG: NADH-quinone oxidoreductase subunit NuoH [Zetaproteobacteria bacterium CG08_land_8_20_14_0_20_55_17]PIW43540.1 MAG: NADH-quinone oxidoreductase subunit NuoH [Zetaproteobacteria bacterium CG12_big_fil_rev_8_21_14_0_65_55_1124]PIY54406.1 MAG: NADH-quinone oxidoreductase subunit NuoH [Zetaproteobacteria bacterium CG_4_10_14_0_8_um_filter_55_43]PIZ39003.1 MAG: NADH-quinone oxidoreductase subuni
MTWLDTGITAGIWALEILAIAVPVALGVAYTTYAERRVIGWIQVRKGCNRVGWAGLLQPIADGLKLVMKETIIPTTANKALFVAAPLLALIPALIAYAVVPFGETTLFGVWETAHVMAIADLNVGVLYVMAISSLSVYGFLMAGWASNSKYTFLGAMRATSQMVSYEIAMGFAIVCVLMMSGSMNLNAIIHAQAGGFWHWYLIPLFPMFMVYFISGCAEVGRTPFDLIETEELVSGYFTEYSGMWFATFSLAEYGAMILISLMTSILFLGGWYAPLPVLDFIPGTVWLLGKTTFLIFVFIWFRATFPRYRYDQLMRLGWKVFLPLTLIWLAVIGLAIFTPGVSDIINYWRPGVGL